MFDCAVIIPVFNRRTTVGDALASVQSQTEPPARLVVVDDGSTDGTPEAVQRWLAQHSLPFPVEVVSQANAGVAAARNRGLRAAGGVQFVAGLDSDDCWPRDFLQRAQRAFRDQPDAVAASCDRCHVNFRNGTRQQHSLAGLAKKTTQWLMANDAGISSATVLRRESVSQLGGFDEQLRTGEDTALFLRLTLLGTWLHFPGEAVEFRHGLGPIRSEADNLSGAFHDNHRRWAQVYEDFVVRAGGRKVLDKAYCRRMLAGRWYRAGRELMRGQRNREATECFQQSLKWSRWNRSWLRIMQANCRIRGAESHRPLG